MRDLRRHQLRHDVDLVIVGAGFAGSLMAMVAHQLGLTVVLLEQGKHPRMAIGESTTPLSNLLLERLADTYNLPRLRPLAKWGTWQNSYPQVACGLKRGFSFFHADGELLVAASPHDAIADTHWYRADVDYFLVQEAQRLGVTYVENARMDRCDFAPASVTVTGCADGEPFDVHAGFLIDGTGPRGFIHRTLGLEESCLPGLPERESLYCHFTGVGHTASADEATPHPVDDAAVHHVFDGGWVWVLRFNNGVTSAGVAATKAVAQELRLHEGAPAWQRLLERLPALHSQFADAVPCQPFRHMPTISFRSSQIFGTRWAMLPSAAGFVDPLLSTGFSLTLLGIEKLAHILQAQGTLEEYAEQTENNLLTAARIIGALYATMGDFHTFAATSMIYFAAVSFSETAQRLGRPGLAPGFLLDRHPEFGPASRALLERAGMRDQAFVADVQRLIEPFNLGRFGDPARQNNYPVHAEDLLATRSKLEANEDEIQTMLDSAGFYPKRAVLR